MLRTTWITLLVFWLTIASLAQSENLALDWDPAFNNITGSIELSGTANLPDQLTFYVEAAHYDPDMTDAVAWTPVVLPPSASVVNDVFGAWHTSVFPDGLYQLRLHAITNARESFYVVLAPIAVTNDGTVSSSEPVQVIASKLMETETAAEAAAAPEIENRLPLPVGGHIMRFDDETQAALRSAGMTWVKKQVQYGISDGRDLIEAAHAQGFKVMLGALGDKNRLAEDFDAYVADFAEYVAFLARNGADAIEVWNEPNIDREWPRGQVHGANYTRLLKAAYEAIKAANPDTLVISGAPAPTGFFGGRCQSGGCDDHVFMQQMASAGAANYADCIGAHYNEGIIAPIQQGGDPRDNYQTRYLPLMLQRVAWSFRNYDIPMCMTEMGYLSPEGYGPLPGNFAWAANTSVREQAQWLAQAIQISANFEDMPVEMVIVWNIDFDTYDADPQAGYAIIRADGSCPACETIAALRR